MIVRAVLAREREGKEFGVIVLAEGLAQYLPAHFLEGVKFDDHGNISLSQTNLARNMTKLVEAEYERRTGKKRRVTGVQLGYEARCACPMRSTSSWAASSASGPTAPWSRTSPMASWSPARAS